MKYLILSHKETLNTFNNRSNTNRILAGTCSINECCQIAVVFVAVVGN